MVIEFTEINMVHRKIKYKIINYTVLCTLVLFSCKKEAKDPIYVSMNAILAHNNQPVSGIKWSITEAKGGGTGSDQELTDREMNGETDANGISVFEFHPLKNKKYYYDISFDYSKMNIPAGDYSIVHGPTSFARLVREHSNDYEIRILPKMVIYFHYKNTNCFDGMDKFKFKSFNYDERPNTRQVDVDSWPWNESSLNNGCVDSNLSGTALAGHYIYFWEATRNGVVDTGIDTFYVSPDGNNLIELFW